MPSPTAAAGSAAPGTASPVARASSARAGARIRGPSAAGPTMSPRTAPASIDVSCPGSPTRISRASGRTASTSRPIIESETIEVSSTTTTSCGSRLPRWWRKRLCVRGCRPSSRCSVTPPSASSCSRTASAASSSRAAACTASSSRAAAFPVGAASATCGAAAPAAAACSASSATIRATVVVLPVPGPPATTAKRRRTAVAAARRWPSSSAPASMRAEAVREHVQPHAGGRRLAEGEQVGGQAPLLAPVAVEVEAGADEPERAVRRAVVLPGRDERARRQPPRPAGGLGPRQRAEVDGLVRLDRRGVAHRREVDVDVPEPRPAHGERGREQHLRVVVAAQRGDPQRDVHVGRGEHARRVEGGRAARAPGARGARRTGPARPAPSITSRSPARARRSAPRPAPPAASRRRRRTARRRPAACPGPVMPRRNR